MRRASIKDLEQLVTMMGEFYAESPYILNTGRAADAFRPLLADQRLGHVWFIQADAKDVGYVVVTLGYSMEYGGPIAIIDDLFVKPAFRGRGLGKAALAELRTFCANDGISALEVETGLDNAAALAVYRDTGFEETGRLHLRLGLADPTHAP